MMKTKTFKRPIASLSAVVMFMVMLLYFPSGTFSNINFGLKASAEAITPTEPLKNGSGVYQIGTKEELYWFANKVNTENGTYGSANAVLTADITVNTGVLTDDGKLNTGDFTSWTPIGNYFNQYTGTFDGQNHTISGLYLKDSSAYYVGLFGCILNGTVKNVSVKDSYFNAFRFVGGVCGENYSGTIENCYNTSSVNVTDYVGGVCGVNSGLIQNCYNTGTVTAKNDIHNLNTKGRYSGGVCGENRNTIKNCYNVGNVTSSYYYNGATGDNYYTGGVSGYNSGTIENCYNIGTVSGSYYSTGGVCGENTNTIQNCYYLDTIKSDSNATSVTTEQFASGEITYLLNGSTSEGTLIWGQTLLGDDKQDYPVLGGATVYKNESKDSPDGVPYFYGNTSHTYNNGFCTDCGKYQPATETTVKYDINNDGTKDTVYEIYNVGQLYWFAGLVNGDESVCDYDETNNPYGTKQDTSANAVLMNDITVNMGVLNANGELNTGNFTSWTPIGNDSVMYSGTFDGQNHTVSGLYYNNTNTQYIGLFGRVDSDCKISNVGVIDSYFSGSRFIGGVCGANRGTIENCYSLGVSVTSSGSSVGGVCGADAGGTIKNCYSSANVSGVTDGGVCGLLNINGLTGKKGTITNCYFDSNKYNGTAVGYNMTGENIIDNALGKTTDEFKSGEVAYLLNGSTSEGTLAWGQTLSGNDKQDYPVLGGATVYQNETHNCVGYVYANATADSVYADHKYDENGICPRCGGYKPADKNASGVYEISTVGQLYWFAEQVNSGSTSINAVLKKDIDFSNRTFTAIGKTENCKFRGTFDGDNHKITVNQSNSDYVAIFGYISDCTIKNLNVTGTINTAVKYAAGIAMKKVDNNTTANIENCISDVNIVSSVSGDGTHGGIIGNVDGTINITNCAFTGSMNGESTTSCGGLIGWTQGTANISNSYVSAVFGVSDSSSNTFSRNDSKVTLNNCYYLNELGSVPSSGVKKMSEEQFANGEVAYLLNGSTSEGTLIWGQTLSGDNKQNFPVLGGEKVYQNKKYSGCIDSPKESTTIYTNTNQDIYAEHDYDKNGFCKYCNKYQPATKNTSGIYEISNAGQLYWFANYVNSGNTSTNAVLTADITMNSNLLNSLIYDAEGNVTNGDSFTSWTPIGNSSKNYTGTFDGQNHTISGLYFNDTNTTYVGLFGWNRGTVKNVGVKDSYFKGSKCVGGVCGDNRGTITNCYNTGTVSGTSSVGGVCGINYNGITTNCYSIGIVSGTSNVGGVCGRNDHSYGNSSTIKNCYYNNTVYTKSAVGYNPNSDTIEYVEGKATNSFISGEVAYLLSQGCKIGEITYDGSVWGQTLSGDNKQNSPVLDGANVYRNETYSSCIDKPGEPTYSYSNTSADPVYKEHDYDKNGFCKYCDNYKSATKNANGVYEISNVGQLYWFADYVNNGNTSANAILTADIDFSNRTFISIGTSDYPFSGTFDGGSYKITVEQSESDYVAIFGCISDCTIKNLTVTGVINTNTKYSAGIAMKKVDDTTTAYIENCISDVNIVSSVSGDGTHGGIIGNVDGTINITNCAFTGSMTGENTISCGGLIGYTNGTANITNSYVSAEFNINSDSTNCSTFSRNESNVTLTNCYYLNTLGTIPNGVEHMTADKFNSGEVAHLLSQGCIVNNITYDGSIWGQTIGTDTYPVLGGAKVYYESEHSIYYNCEPAFYNQNDKRYEISNASQLYWFAGLVNGTLDDVTQNKSANAILMNDITVNDKLLNSLTYDAKGNVSNGGGFKKWTPIGNSSNIYNGTFDGNNYTIRGLYFNNTDTTTGNYVGLFGYVEDGSVSNVSVEDSYFNGYDYVSGVCGLNGSNSTITNCYNTGTVSGSYDVGGMCGENNGTIKNSYNTGTVSGLEIIGGVCGYNCKGTVENCYNTGTVSGTSDVGGVCGGNYKGTITKCYYLKDCNAKDTIFDCNKGTSKTTEQFAIGEVAYLLNGSTSEGTLAWGQTLSGDNKQNCPVLGGAKVYQNKEYSSCCIDSSEKSTIIYTNTNEDVYAEHDYSSGGICKNCDALKNGKDGFKSASLTLTDGVIINYYLILSSDALSYENAYIHFTSTQGLDKKIMLSEGVKDNDGKYKFSLELRPDQMSEEITAKVVYSDSSEGSSVKYSVQKYAENQSDTTDTKTSDLINAMLYYGAATQNYTGNNTDNLANKNVNAEFNPNVTISDDYKMSLSGTVNGIKVKGASLIAGSLTTIKVKYEVTEGSIDDFTFTCDGAELTPVQEGNYYYVYIRNINPNDIDKMYSIVVTDKDNNSRTLKYSALTYAKSVIEAEEGKYPSTLVDMMKALYYYNKAADAYVNVNE